MGKKSSSKKSKHSNNIKSVGSILFKLFLFSSIVVVIYLIYSFFQPREVVLLGRKRLEKGSIIKVNVPCIEEIESTKYDGCSPEFCSRVIIDNFVNEKDIIGLREIANTAMLYGGGTGGPTIFDLNSGALSKDDSFIDAFEAIENDPSRGKYFTRKDFELLVRTKERIQATIMQHFGLNKLYLTSPTFFARLDGDKEPMTLHDEYWHQHVDTIAYGSFVYTGLLYLSDYEHDFEGGEFVYIDEEGRFNQTVAPMSGRLSFFTSGHENVHQVRRVNKGKRLTLTIAFTCDPEMAIDDFLADRKHLFVEPFKPNL